MTKLLESPVVQSAKVREKIRLSFLCAGDPENVLVWSGTPKHMLTALKREFDVRIVIREPWLPGAQLLRRFVRRISRRSIDLAWWPPFIKLMAFKTISRILDCESDVVFAVAITPICAQIVTQRPTIFVSDATFAAMADYNPLFSKLVPLLKRTAQQLETRCIQHATVAFFPSEWACRSAIRDHEGQRDRVVQIPWGPNMAPTSITAPEDRSSSVWRLLFIGTNWHGKGGDIALQTTSIMRQRGFDVHLDVVGASPKDKVRHLGVEYHGFLDKKDPDHYRLIGALYQNADVFFLPTRFEALGIVFAEAASYAIPSVSYATGGVPAMVENGVTGLLLPEGAAPEAFAESLIELLSDRSGYIQMSHAALAKSQNEMSWDVWAKRIRVEVEGQLEQRHKDVAALRSAKDQAC